MTARHQLPRAGRPPATGPGPIRPLDWGLALTRAATAIVFIGFGLGKFVDHASESSSFRGYGLPLPGAFATSVGVLELVGGLFLIAGLATRATSALLAGDMVGAIVVSGILHGETISLTLAPALLLAMLALIASGPGRASLDAALIARRPPTAGTRRFLRS